MDSPIASPIAWVVNAMSSDQGTLMPISSNSGRSPRVRVRARSPMTSRQPVMNSAGTSPIARRGTTTSATTPTTSATVETTRCTRTTARETRMAPPPAPPAIQRPLPPLRRHIQNRQDTTRARGAGRAPNPKRARR